MPFGGDTVLAEQHTSTPGVRNKDDDELWLPGPLSGLGQAGAGRWPPACGLGWRRGGRKRNRLSGLLCGGLPCASVKIPVPELISCHESVLFCLASERPRECGSVCGCGLGRCCASHPAEAGSWVVVAADPAPVQLMRVQVPKEEVQ